MLFENENFKITAKRLVKSMKTVVGQWYKIIF